MDVLAPEPRRPRPVAGLPAVDGRVVAKAWLVELVAGGSLDDAVNVPTAELAREGPGLATAVVAALSDDNALMRLAPGGNLSWLSARASALAGSRGAGGAVRATEALRRATQAAILAEARLDATTTAELADRLAHVCAVVAEAAAAQTSIAAAVSALDAVTADQPVDSPVSTLADEPFAADAEASHAAAPVPAHDHAPEERVAAPGPAPLVIADPLAEAPIHRIRHPDPRPAPVAPPHSDADVVSLHRSDAAEALRRRDERRAEAGSVQTAIERRLERHAHDGSPFALMSVEADGLERLRAAEPDEVIDELLEAIERALAAELRPADQLLRDEPGLYWVTAPDTGPAVGRLLAERLAEAATAAASHRGAPLTVSIGVATCPDNGEDFETLSERAGHAMFQARAAGSPVA